MPTIVMTGATQGIGLVAARRILSASQDVHLVVLARDVVRAREHFIDAVAARRVTLLPADLLSRDSLLDAVEEVGHLAGVGMFEAPSVLVLNAGAQYKDARTTSADGYEATFAVNVFANHLLMRSLGERLPADGRIVVTVCDTHFGDLRHNLGMMPAPQWRDPAELSVPTQDHEAGTVRAAREAYSTSKLAAIHLVHEFARRHPSGPTVLGYNPGFVPATGLAREASRSDRFAMRALLPGLTLTPLASTPRQAGGWLADLALGRRTAASGSYVNRTRVEPSSPESYDAARERALWDTLDEAL